ncbi:Nesprin-1 [Manis pentadactyla]|nr:Nesprin-1 [Manis pentadactyla]
MRAVFILSPMMVNTVSTGSADPPAPPPPLNRLLSMKPVAFKASAMKKPEIFCSVCPQSFSVQRWDRKVKTTLEKLLKSADWAKETKVAWNLPLPNTASTTAMAEMNKSFLRPLKETLCENLTLQ